jgi:hypothetical protein
MSYGGKLRSVHITAGTSCKRRLKHGAHAGHGKIQFEMDQSRDQHKHNNGSRPLSRFIFLAFPISIMRLGTSSYSSLSRAGIVDCQMEDDCCSSVEEYLQ